jgi:hypothetical protein
MTKDEPYLMFKHVQTCSNARNCFQSLTPFFVF